MMEQRRHRWFTNSREALKKIFHRDKAQDKNLSFGGGIQEASSVLPNICTSPTSNLDILNSLQTREAYKSFEYWQLSAQEIRLWTLLPGTSTSAIRICLETVVFTNELVPEFEALSYTWGSPENHVDLLVKNSMDTTISNFGTLALASNLAEALPFLRHRDRPRVLWNDAICVNQQDMRERTSKVK